MLLLLIRAWFIWSDFCFLKEKHVVMKAFFTFIISLLISINGFAQKTGTSVAVITSIQRSFSIEKVYPNPVKDFVTVELQSEESGELQISLINILGTEVKKWDNFFLNSGSQKLQLDLSQFKVGVYILRITKQGMVKTQVLKKS